MKKRFIALFFFLLIFSILLSGCSRTIIETINSEKTETSVGNYSLFRTTDVQVYLSFLENFDETKYEIVDISTSMDLTSNGYSNEFYIVTYKTISE